MSELVERLRRLHAEGHAREVEGLRDDRWFSPPEVRDAAVLAAITDGPRPGFLLIHRPTNMRSHPGAGRVSGRQGRSRRNPGRGRTARGL